jgi:hypothetical protein
MLIQEDQNSQNEGIPAAFSIHRAPEEVQHAQGKSAFSLHEII